MDVDDDFAHFMQGFVMTGTAVDDVPFDQPAGDTDDALSVWDRERAA